MKLSVRLARMAKSKAGASTGAAGRQEEAADNQEATKSPLLAAPRSTANRLYLGARRMFSSTTRYTCLVAAAAALLLLLLPAVPGAHSWNPYEALEYRTFQDPPMDPGLALALTQPLPLVSPLANFLGPSNPQPLFAPMPAPPAGLELPANQSPAVDSQTLSAPAPATEVKSVMSQLADKALEVAGSAAASLAHEVAASVVQTSTPSRVAESPATPETTALASTTADAPAAPKPEVDPTTKPQELAGPVNSPVAAPNRPLSPAGKILGELVNSKNASERLASVAFQLLRPRKQPAEGHRSHAYAEQQIISQHADPYQRQLLQPVRHRDTSGPAPDGARNSALSSALSTFKASKGISSRSSIVKAMSDNKLARALGTLGKSITGNKYIAGAAAASVLAALGLTATKFLSPYLLAGGYSKLGEPMLGSGSFVSPIFASPARHTSAALDSMLASSSAPAGSQFLTGYPASSLGADAVSTPIDGPGFAVNQPPTSTAGGALFQRFSNALSNAGGGLRSSLYPAQPAAATRLPGDSAAGYYSDYYSVPYSMDAGSGDLQQAGPQQSTFSIVGSGEPQAGDADQMSSATGYLADAVNQLPVFTNAAPQSQSPPRRLSAASTGSTSRRSGTVTLKLDKATRERLLRLKREQELLSHLNRHSAANFALQQVAAANEPPLDAPATFVSFSPIGRQPEPSDATSVQPVWLAAGPEPQMLRPVTQHRPPTTSQQVGPAYVYVRSGKRGDRPTLNQFSESLGERPLVVTPAIIEAGNGGSAWRLMVPQDSLEAQPSGPLTSMSEPQKEPHRSASAGNQPSVGQQQQQQAASDLRQQVAGDSPTVDSGKPTEAATADGPRAPTVDSDEPDQMLYRISRTPGGRRRDVAKESPAQATAPRMLSMTSSTEDTPKSLRAARHLRAEAGPAAIGPEPQTSARFARSQPLNEPWQQVRHHHRAQPAAAAAGHKSGQTGEPAPKQHHRPTTDTPRSEPRAAASDGERHKNNVIKLIEARAANNSASPAAELGAGQRQQTIGVTLRGQLGVNVAGLDERLVETGAPGDGAVAQWPLDEPETGGARKKDN